MTFDQLMNTITTLDQERRYKRSMSTCYDITTENIRAELKQQVIELEAEIRLLILNFIKGERKDG